MRIVLKKATPADAQTLADLGASTFIQTFAAHNTKEDMDHYLSQTFSESKQRAEILDPRRRIEMAWQGGQAIGFVHLLAGSREACVMGEKPMELLRIYVDSPWHGKGVGVMLMERALHLSRGEGFKTLWLGVWEHNYRAQAFYRRYGFEVVGNHIFRVGTDDQLDFIMARSI